METETFTSRKPTDWARRIGSRVTNGINNFYQMIYPKELSPSIASADMAPALQVGRMDIAPANSGERTQWYSGLYVPNYGKVPDCIRGRRWNAVRGDPSYAVVYEFEHERVSESAERLAQRDIYPDNPRMRDLMTHAAGSPGTWKKIFQV